MKTLLTLDNARKKRRNWVWTHTNIKRAKDVMAAADELRDYWPITERHIYYRLISNGCTNEGHWRQHNNPLNPPVKIYNALCTLLKWMRIDRKLPWRAVADETRILTAKVGFESMTAFIRQDLADFLRGYSRCVAQDQRYHIEVWIEKQTLLKIVEPVADQFCRRVLCCRGYNSITFQADFYSRTMDAIEHGLKPAVLYFGDWDPSGVNMIYAAMQTIHDEFGLSEDQIEFHRCGIKPDHFNLIHKNPEPLQVKQSDSRTKGFVKQYGPTCYELDALHPEQLQRLVHDSIKRFTDMEALSCNLDVQDREHAFIANLRADVRQYTMEKLKHASTF